MMNTYSPCPKHGRDTKSETGIAPRLKVPMALGAMLALASPTAAGVTTVFDQTAWSVAAGGAEWISAIDFGGFPLGTIITDQFASLGVHFTDGDDFRVDVTILETGLTLPMIVSGQHWSIPRTPPTGITMTFDAPQAALAVDLSFAGLPISFYLGDRLVASMVVETIPAPYFIGFLSDQPFDRVVFEPYSGGYHILSNTYFSQVPAPGTVALLAVATLLPRRRRAE